MEVVLTNKFLRQLRRLHPEAQTRIARIIDDLGADKIKGEKLEGRLKKCYKLRVGNYRVIYQILSGNAYLVDVGHRQNIYD